MKCDWRTRLLIVGVLQVDNRVVRIVIVTVHHHLLIVVVDGKSVGCAEVYPKIIVVLPISVRPKKGTSINSIDRTLCPLPRQIRLESILLPLPHHLVLL